MNSYSTIPNNLDISNFTPQEGFEFCVQQTIKINHINYSDYQTVEYSFFYLLRDDIYHIICEEIHNFHGDSENNPFQHDNVYNFDYKQPDTKKFYRFTCRNLSSTFNFQFLNKIIYGSEFIQIKQQKGFPVKNKEMLENQLKKDLISYLALNQSQTKDYILDLKFIEVYQHYYSSRLNDSSNENEKKLPSRCMWTEDSVKLLLSFLTEHREKVNMLAAKRRGGSKIKTKLWNDAVTMLSKKGYTYTSQQCSIKWKNIKKDYNDSNNQNNRGSSSNNPWYKLVKKILSENTNLTKLHEKFNEEIKISKRKILDEDRTSNKAFKSINGENMNQEHNVET
ncbi:unnamed protein product [Rhizophagus irregularis]|uniref:Myb/SANT-like DNA-binding domain-containing protein n=1 Tax=Rhizophagus irregularis TaxID=588596 RepID=A0A2I1G8Z4_9GLOM|nr:hypothetical protein RhiirA4_417988 [Rhizophagus irregularis]CAB4443987.1 unnamed protein product [Rhizophagus irregularis]